MFFPIAIFKKKNYFCGTKNCPDASKNPDRLPRPRLYNGGRIAFRIPVVDAKCKTGLFHAIARVFDPFRIEHDTCAAGHPYVQEKTATVCDQQAEHDIKFNFARVDALPIAKRIWRREIA